MIFRSEHIVDFWLIAYKDIHENQVYLNFYEVFLLYFIQMFCRDTTRENIKYNKLYQLAKELKENGTKEAKYFNGLLINRQIVGDRMVV